MKITIFTLFPGWFAGPLGDSILQRAQERGLIELSYVNFRDFATDKHASVDDTPYGGGGGMVLRADVLARALDDSIGAVGHAARPRTILMSPRGRRFDQRMAIELAALPSLAIVCGHYEAVDQRLIDTRIDEEVSLGDFVLTGGEIPAMAIVDAVARLLPGVLGNETSSENESFMNGLLEAPHYTRPEVFEERRVPDVLLSGNHAAIAQWREEQSLALTSERRPDLFPAQLLWPEQVRRLARRSRPFAVWRREGDHFDWLYVPAFVTAQDGWEERLRTLRSEAGIQPQIRVAEIKDVRLEDATADTARVRADAVAALAAMDRKAVYTGIAAAEAATMLRNLLGGMAG